MADLDTYDGDVARPYEDDYPPRDRSRSPVGDRDRDRDQDTRIRDRDEPSNGRSDRGPPPERNGGDEETQNPGSNLFVTGIHPRLSEEEVSRLFEKYGVVEKCNIMRDPHTRESRGFGFVKMTTPEGAEAAKDGLQGEVYEGRTLSIERARRSRPRTPTPGKYFGPPKRDDRPPRAGGGGFRDRYDDRGYGRRDDYRRGAGGYRDRYDDRGYGRRDDYGARGGERGGDRDYDRQGSRNERYDRRGYGGGGYDRAPRGPPPESSGYGADAAPREGASSRSYDDRRRYD